MYYEHISSNGYPVIGIFSVIVKDILVSAESGSYKFGMHVGFDNKEIFKAAKWCQENIKDDWVVGSNHSGFNNKDDAFAFKMRWM